MADIVERLIVDLVRDIGVLQEGMHAKHCVVRLDARRGDLRAGPDREGDLGLLAVVDRETLKEQAAKTRTGASTAGVEHHEALEAGAVVGQLAQTVEDEVDDLLADGVMPTGEVVSRILLAGNQ